MASKGPKESLKQARKDAGRQVPAQIAALVEERPDLSYRRIAQQFGCGTGLVCQAAKQAGCAVRVGAHRQRSKDRRSRATGAFKWLGKVGSGIPLPSRP